MSKTILIIGGTGLIGKTIAEKLSQRDSSLNILIGTRKKESKPNYLSLDVNDPNTFEILNNHPIDLIVVCTKDTNNTVLEYAVKNNINYIDVTKPTNELIKAHHFIENKVIESKIVFSSGWMGGIVPLLLFSKNVTANDIKNLTVYVYYSSKDKAGESSADFMAQNVNTFFSFYQDDVEMRTKHFLNTENHVFDFDGQKRKVFDFDVPDLYILHKIEKIPSVKVKLTFDSKLITAALAIMQKINFFKLLNFKERKLIFGGSGPGDISSFEIVFTTHKSTREKVTLKCLKGQSELTAFSTVLHIEKLLQNPIQNGVYCSHQLHNPKEFIAALTSNKNIIIG